MAERDRYGANDIKPGLTGLAQINGRDELEIPVKAKFDGEYVKALKKGMTSGFLMDTNVVSDYKSIQDDGTNPLRVLVYAMPTILAFWKRKRIAQVSDNLIDFCINMSIISTGLYIISMFTSGIFIGRLPIYASLYGYILLPWEIETLFADKTRKIIKICMIFAYLVFYYYQLHLTWGLM